MQISCIVTVKSTSGAALAGRPCAAHLLDAFCFFSSAEPSRFHFFKPENYISMYHQEGSDTLYVGGQAMIYVLTFTNRGVDDLQVTKSTFQLIRRSEGIHSIC